MTSSGYHLLAVEDWEPRSRMRVFSSLGGFIFAMAWWIMVDAAVFVDHSNDPLKLQPVFWLPGAGTTICFFVVVLMDWGALHADELTHFRARETRLGARAVLLFAVFLGLASLGLSVWILAEIYAGHKGYDGKLPDSSYPGVCIFIQTFLLFVGSFVTRLGRLDVEESF